MIEKVEKGLYRHFKGALYHVDGVATHTETNEEFVVYFGEGQLWVLPLKNFLEEVSPGVKRFTKIKTNQGV